MAIKLRVSQPGENPDVVEIILHPDVIRLTKRDGEELGKPEEIGKGKMVIIPITAEFEIEGLVGA